MARKKSSKYAAPIREHLERDRHELEKATVKFLELLHAEAERSQESEPVERKKGRRKV